MALAMAIFALGPISAPLVGYGLVALTGWRGVFIGMASLRPAAGVGRALVQGNQRGAGCDRSASRRLRQSLRRIAGHPQSRYFLIVAAATQFGIISFVANGPRFFKSAFGIDGLEFALLFAATGLGIVLGQIANNRLIARLGVLTTTRIAAFVLLAVTTLVVLLSLADALPGMAFTGLMFMFNTSFLVVMANAASLVIDPHREIAGFASSAYGFFTQITASVLAVLTVPLFAGALLPWSLTMLAVTLSVFVLIVVYRPVAAASVSAGRALTFAAFCGNARCVPWVSTLTDKSAKLATACSATAGTARTEEVAMNMNTQQIVTIIVVGIVAGWLASLVVGGGGLLRYLITGILGAFVGGWLFNAAGWKLNLGSEIVDQIVISAIGAIVLVLLARLIA